MAPRARPEKRYPILDYIAACEARDAGLQSALSDQDEWRLGYRFAASLFMAESKAGDRFLGEDLRVFALQNGVGHPRHPNAWGAMARSALNEWLRTGQVERVDMAPAKAVRSHACVCPVYRVMR